jgi:ABC-2 type transport system ATP-binding protein
VVAVPEDQNLIATAPNTPSIELTNVSKWYGSVVAVNDISFQVMPGITGLLGPNGAGKTTLLHMMAGLAKPSEGEITMLGESVRNNYKLYSRMGVMSEHEAVYSVFTGRQLVEFSAKMQGITDVKGHSDWAINMVNLEDAQHRALGTYSRGMRQRMRLAASMVHDPEVLILDEPLNGTDPRQRLEFHDLMLKLAAEGRTILISSHILEEVETLADTILLVVSGKLAAAGDYRAIREKLDERPFQVRIASSDSRLLASELMKLDAIDSVTMQDDGTLLVLSRNVAVLQTSVARLAKVQGVRLHRVEPMDESLESVFTYVVARSCQPSSPSPCARCPASGASSSSSSWPPSPWASASSSTPSWATTTALRTASPNSSSTACSWASSCPSSS